MIIDSWFDNYVGVVMLVRVVDGSLSKGERIRMMATDAVYGSSSMGVFTPKSVPRETLKAGEVGFVIAGIKELQAAKVGDTVTLEKKLPNNAGPGHRGAARLQGDPAAGLRRPVPDRGERVRPAARRAGEAQAQRQLAALRARGQPGAGLRLPLRLPRPAAHGDRAGAARARVRPGPDHHRAERGLPGRAERRHGAAGREPVQDARPRAASARSASRSSPCTCTCRRTTWAR